ncbi:MAG: hypothetical protein ABSF50_19335 [Burkholderiaceae bacterium]|jgi:hypothetical protein
MLAGAIGRYIVTARGIPQGTLWVGVYSVKWQHDAYSASEPFFAETHTDETFATQAEAAEAAFREGQRVAEKSGKNRD